ncbi:MAG TPA: hypothetical protein PLN56_08960 [Methanoregulaceae archaeon]|nr:hypothetical protein [Methanoregulaceae archaeon]
MFNILPNGKHEKNVRGGLTSVNTGFNLCRPAALRLSRHCSGPNGWDDCHCQLHGVSIAGMVLKAGLALA